MQRLTLAAASGFLHRFRRFPVGVLLALLGLFQVAGASARTSTYHAPRGNSVRPAATIPDTSFTWVAHSSPGATGPTSDTAEDVAFLQDGRIAATGTVELATGQQAFAVAVYGTDGSLDWIQTLIGTSAGGNNSGLQIAVDNANNIIATGIVSEQVATPKTSPRQVGSQSGLSFREYIFAISYTAGGAERWRREINIPNIQGAIPNDLAIDSVGNVLIAGTVYDFETSGDFYVAKLLGSDGFVAWQKQFDGQGTWDEAYAVSWVPSANAGEQDDVIAAGTIGGGEGLGQTIVYKIDGDFGAFNHWAEPILRNNEPTAGFGTDVAVNAAGDVIVGGGIDSGNGLEFAVAKLSGANGGTLWTYVKPGETDFQNGFARRVAVGPGGEVVAGGQIMYDEPTYFLTRLNPDTGAEDWMRLINQRADDGVEDLAIDGAGNIATAARFAGVDGGASDFTALLHAPDGTLVWQRTALSEAEGGRGLAQAIAVDNAGNVAAAGSIDYDATGRDFVVAYVDRVAPLLSDVSLMPTTLPHTGGSVLAQVKAIDNVAVDFIEAVVTNPESIESRFTFVPGTGDPDRYERQVPFPSNLSETPKVYKVQIIANDATGNVSTLSVGNVVVSPADLTPPSITNCQLDPTGLPSGGGTVAVTAQVSDNVGVTGVEAFVTRPDSTTFTVPLSLTTGDLYSGNIVVPENPNAIEKTYSVEIRAFDGTNGSQVPCGIITVAAADMKAPVLVSCQVDPTSLPSTGGTVTVSAVVTDNVGVFAVTAIVNPGFGTPFNVTLTRGSGDNWSGTFDVPANTGTEAQNWGVLVKADDAAGNSINEFCGTLLVSGRDVAGPTISNATVTPTSLPSEGGSVLIRATVTDAGGVDQVEALVTEGALPASSRRRPRGGIITPEPVVVPLTHVGNGVYEGTFTAPANTGTSAVTYSVVIEATDTSDNESSASAGSFTVAGFGPGRLQLSTTLVNFGLVNLNNTSRRTFRIRNIGKGILAGEMSLPDAPFQIFIKEGKDRTKPAGKTRGLFFVLQPGEVITVLVEFSPAVHARYASEIRFVTDDPKKKKARVSLKGLGCRVR